MKTFDIIKPIRGSLKHLALAVAVAAGLSAGSAQAQGLTMSVTGHGTNNTLLEYVGEADGYKFTTAAARTLSLAGWGSMTPQTTTLGHSWVTGCWPHTG